MSTSCPPAGAGAREGRRDRPGSADPLVLGYSQGVFQIALRQPRGRCYPLRALGAGTHESRPRTRPNGIPEPSLPVRPPRVLRGQVFLAFRGQSIAIISPSLLSGSVASNGRESSARAPGPSRCRCPPITRRGSETQLVDVDEQRFRIGVPNGFAKDWLETRYRSLISQTLARIVGYSVQVEFVVTAR